MWVAFLFGPGKEEGLLMFDHSIQRVYTCISVRKKRSVCRHNYQLWYPRFRVIPIISLNSIKCVYNSIVSSYKKRLWRISFKHPRRNCSSGMMKNNNIEHIEHCNVSRREREEREKDKVYEFHDITSVKLVSNAGTSNKHFFTYTRTYAVRCS